MSDNVLKFGDEAMRRLEAVLALKGATHKQQAARSLAVNTNLSVEKITEVLSGFPVETSADWDSSIRRVHGESEETDQAATESDQPQASAEGAESEAGGSWAESIQRTQRRDEENDR